MGLPQPLARPGERRIYSNTGYVALAAHLEARTEIPFRTYLDEAVLPPLALAATLDGDAAGGMVGSLRDMLRFGRELSRRRSSHPRRSPKRRRSQFPGLDGVLPGFGRQSPNDWGLGFELRDAKSPHWSGSLNSPRTYGHFGPGPARRRSSGSTPSGNSSALRSPTSRSDTWAAAAWPALSDAVLSEGTRAAGG